MSPTNTDKTAQSNQHTLLKKSEAVTIRTKEIKRGQENEENKQKREHLIRKERLSEQKNVIYRQINKKVTGITKVNKENGEGKAKGKTVQENMINYYI